MKIGVGLGSNLGDREAEMEAAFGFLCTLDPSVRLSPVYESRPQDCPPDSGAFLNAAAVLEWRGGLFGLLDRFQAYEASRGRAAVRPANAPRPVDLDILFCDDLVLGTPRLSVPHPRLGSRHFVLRPLAELVPDFRLPPYGIPVGELCHRFEISHPEEMCRPNASR